MEKTQCNTTKMPFFKERYIDYFVIFVTTLCCVVMIIQVSDRFFAYDSAIEVTLRPDNLSQLQRVIALLRG